MSESIIALQRRDHARMQELIERFQVNDVAGRRAVFRDLVDLVTRHAFAEEEVLFPAARRRLDDGEAITRALEAKHQRANELLQELERRDTDDDGFYARVSELFALLSSDARDEEDVLLPRLAAVVDEDTLVSIGAAWATAKAAAPDRAHPGGPRRPAGDVLAAIPLVVVDRLRRLFARLRSAQ